MGNTNKKESKFTQVKTIYARACVLLLTLNFCLTTYVVLNLNKSVQEQVGSITGAQTVAPVREAAGTPTTETPPTLETTTENTRE